MKLQIKMKIEIKIGLQKDVISHNALYAKAQKRIIEEKIEKKTLCTWHNNLPRKKLNIFHHEFYEYALHM